MGDPSGFFTGFYITLFCTRWRMGRVRAGAGPVGYGPSGSSAPGKLRKRSASGHAAANARRMRLVVPTRHGAPGNFQETKTQRRELGSGQFAGFGNGVAHGEHQPIGGGVENKTDLIGERRTAAGAIGGELGLMQLDQVLGLAARAIQAVIDPLGRTRFEAGDDEADIEA